MFPDRTSRNRVDLGLRITIIVSNIIGLCFLINALILQRYFYTDGYGSFCDGLALTPVSFSLLWTGIWFILYTCSVAHLQLAAIFLDFISLGLAVGLSYLLISWIHEASNYKSLICAVRSNDQCTATRANLLLASEIIAATTILICGALHLVLMIKACRVQYTRHIARRARLAELKQNTDLVRLNPQKP